MIGNQLLTCLCIEHDVAVVTDGNGVRPKSDRGRDTVIVSMVTADGSDAAHLAEKIASSSVLRMMGP